MNDERLPPFEQVVEQYQQRLFDLVYRLFPDVDDAEDLVQEVFFRAWRAYDRFRNDADVYSWLYRITLNLCRERIRSRIAVRKLIAQDTSGTPDDSTDRCATTADPAEPAPGEHLEREELRRRVRDAIGRLPDRFARVIMLRDIGGMSYEEMARVLGISVTAAGVRLNRARALLRKELAHEMKDYL